MFQNLIKFLQLKCAGSALKRSESWWALICTEALSGTDRLLGHSFWFGTSIWVNSFSVKNWTKLGKS